MEKKKLYKVLTISVLVSFLLTFMIVLLDPFVSHRVLAPDTGARHYYWKLQDRNLLNMTIVWVLFAAHLLGNFYLIRLRMKEKTRGLTNGNLHLLIFNLVFILLHQVQSILGYDGLAQDVSVFSSQYSVIFVLVTIILMLMPVRGLIFGWKIKIDPQAMKLLYALHGFVFTFSIVYTFWFHPMVDTIGHLFGFFYMFLLFIQVSMVKTELHTKMEWIIVLEVLVAFHGASVAYFVQNSSLWAMFFFGFSFLFMFTQIYGLKISPAVRRVIQVAFLFIAVLYYASTDITRIHQVLWIPFIEYLNVLVLFGLLKLYTRIASKRQN